MSISSGRRILKLRTAHGNFTLDMTPGPFNFSRQVNRGVALAKRYSELMLMSSRKIVTS